MANEIPGQTDPAATGYDSSLATWAGPYVTGMLGQGAALGNQPYTAYSGPLTAGSSALQDKAFQGIAGLTIPTAEMGGYTPESYTAEGTAQQYMNPYLSASLEPQIAEASRQAEIQRMMDAGRLTKAGAYGGSRQAIMESEGNRNLMRTLADITGKGYNTAYESGRQQFNTEQAQQQGAQDATNRYGLTALQQTADFGDIQRGIESEGIGADYGQFKEERDYPYKQVQYMQSLLQGLPVEAQSTTFQEPGILQLLGQGAAGGMGIWDQIAEFLNPAASPTPASAGTTTP